MKPLPATRYEYAEWKSAIVNIDYHIDADGHYYSVPNRLVKQKVDVRMTASTVECFYHGKRVAAHLRSFVRGRHTSLAEERITFTRGRAWKKNDGCFVEQKNYSVVRRAVGYARYEGQGAVRLLNALYRELRLYSNFFQPVMKLLRKERSGAKVKKT